MTKQLEHSETFNKIHDLDITVVCDHISSPENAGMIARLCEAFGVRNLIFIGQDWIANSKFKRSSRSVIERLQIIHHPDVGSFLTSMPTGAIYILERTNTSINLKDARLEGQGPIVLILGNEKKGVSPEMLALKGTCLAIPMYGLNTSMNVANACAIALYHIVE